MNVPVLECHSDLNRSNCEKLYLNSKSADVHFVIGRKRVPAHKLILSVGSPAFDTMFNGSLTEKGDVEIVDASAEAFREFLQFFYKSNVLLSPEHIAEVANLCKKYEMPEALKMCEGLLQKVMNVDNACWGYELAILLEQKNLEQFCEQKIQDNAKDILQSKSFKECNRKMFEKILQLVSTEWSHLETVNAFMTWASAECVRNDLDEDTTNIRAQLNDLFGQIPFDKLKFEEFSAFIESHHGFFTVAELEAIIPKIALNKATGLELKQQNRIVTSPIVFESIVSPIVASPSPPPRSPSRNIKSTEVSSRVSRFVFSSSPSPPSFRFSFRKDMATNASDSSN